LFPFCRESGLFRSQKNPSPSRHSWDTHHRRNPALFDRGPLGGSWDIPLKRLGAFASIPNGFSGIPIPLTAPKFNSSPLKSYRTQKEIVFQASFFRGYVKLWCFFVLLKGCEVEKLVSVDDNKFHYGRLIGTRDFQRFLMTSS